MAAANLGDIEDALPGPLPPPPPPPVGWNPVAEPALCPPPPEAALPEGYFFMMNSRILEGCGMDCRAALVIVEAARISYSFLYLTFSWKMPARRYCGL